MRIGGSSNDKAYRAGVVVVLAAAGGIFVASQMDTSAPDAVFRDGFEQAAEQGPPVPIDPCIDPLVAPLGWEIVNKTWVQAFSAPNGNPNLVATYPKGIGYPVPIPGFFPGVRKTDLTLANMIRKGQILVIGPFVAPPNTTVTLTWDNVQSNTLVGYTQPRPADMMFVAMSRCAADLRMEANDACAKLAGSAQINWTTKPAPSAAVCQAQAGGTYWYTVVMADPRDGLTVGEHTCSDIAPNSANGCDVQMKHTAVQSQ